MKIIGGPALRSTNAKAFHVWLVLDERPASIEAVALGAQSHAHDAAIGRSTQASLTPIRLGNRLYLYLLKVNPVAASYPLDTKIYYNVVIDGRSLRSATLFHGDLGKQPLTYGGDMLPSLVIPAKHSRILQLSCRKPHGDDTEHGNADMAAKVDSLLASHVDDPAKRPSLMVATGDQIYADDVAAPLLCGLIPLAQAHTGWSEVMPTPRGGGGGKTVEPAGLKLGRRDSKLARRRGFSANKKDHHLMTFGEYLCMYLAVFGGLPVELPDYASVLDRIPLKTRTVGRKKIREPVIGRDDYETERSRVRRFLETAWKLRRAMANVPTYTILDDHEVSDDWNLTEKNRNALRAPGTLGRRLQANALAAYWACQGYGNDPAQFDSAFTRTVSSFLAAKTQIGGARFESTLLDRHWDYAVDGYPLVMVLDTRTQRAYPSGEKFSSLMSPGAIRALGDAIEAANTRYAHDLDGQSLLLVSAAPVLGFLALERLQLGASALPRLVDGEPWIGSERAYDRLKKALARTRFGNCLVFSGDVHYAYVRKLELANADGRPLPLYQLTSSAANNVPGGFRRFFVRQFEKKDLRKFNRQETPYLFPDGLENEHFVDGSNNVGLLELVDGRPKSYRVYFKDASTAANFTWKYTFGTASIVDFS